MPSKKKKYNSRFPPARIKKIMQTDDEVGKVAAAVPVIISKALELFVESLITKASEITQSKNAKTLTTSHLKHCILAESKFDFLKDLVINVPDVQGEDDNSNSGVSSSTSTISNSYSGDQVQAVLVKPRQQRLRKQKLNADPANSAGPSHQNFGESEEDGTTDEDDEEEEDEEESSASDQQKLKHFNNLSVPNNVIYHPSSYAVNAVPLQVPVIHGPSSLLNLNNNDDEDYDS